VEAVRLYRLAAEQGYSTGQYYLALKLRDGVGIAQNLAEAKRYFKLAADQGHAEATQALAKF
jgi:TPR repeat protein